MDKKKKSFGKDHRHEAEAVVNKAKGAVKEAAAEVQAAKAAGKAREAAVTVKEAMHGAAETIRKDLHMKH